MICIFEGMNEFRTDSNTNLILAVAELVHIPPLGALDSVTSVEQFAPSSFILNRFLLTMNSTVLTDTSNPNDALTLNTETV